MQNILQFAKILLWCKNDFSKMRCTLPHQIKTSTLVLIACIEALHITDVAERLVSWFYTVHSIKQFLSINWRKTTLALVITVNGFELCFPCSSSFKFQGLLQRNWPKLIHCGLQYSFLQKLNHRTGLVG